MVYDSYCGTSMTSITGSFTASIINSKCETPHVTEEEITAAFIKVMNILITEKE